VKRIRIDPEAYEEGACFSLTLTTTGRRRFFVDEAAVILCLEALKESAASYLALVYAYCFMPDHLHLLVSARPGFSLVAFVRHFKQLTAYRFRRLASHRGEELWQRRFYDHALRSEEQIESVATYIWENPVRAGLAEDFARYPFSGSFVWDWDELSGSKDPDLRGFSVLVR